MFYICSIHMRTKRQHPVNHRPVDIKVLGAWRLGRVGAVAHGTGGEGRRGKRNSVPVLRVVISGLGSEVDER